MSDSLLIEHADGIATLTLNRPDSLNSLNLDLKQALLHALDEIDKDETVRAVLITGAGRAFCVGQDLREHVETLESGTTDPLATVREHYNPIVKRMVELTKPVVAAVNGSAAGAGASLALLADFRIGGPSTSILMAFARVGLAADTGASWTLPQIVGHAKATEMLMLAKPVSAEEAQRLGLLTELVPDDAEVLPAARALARKLAEGPTAAYSAIKWQLAVAAKGDLDTSLGTEAEAQSLCGRTDDHRNATAAFVAKEKPVFTGK